MAAQMADWYRPRRHLASQVDERITRLAQFALCPIHFLRELLKLFVEMIMALETYRSSILLLASYIFVWRRLERTQGLFVTSFLQPMSKDSARRLRGHKVHSDWQPRATS